MPGIARKKNEKKVEQKIDLLAMSHPHATHECPQKKFSPYGPAVGPVIGT